MLKLNHLLYLNFAIFAVFEKRLSSIYLQFYVNLSKKTQSKCTFYQLFLSLNCCCIFTYPDYSISQRSHSNLYQLFGKQKNKNMIHSNPNHMPYASCNQSSLRPVSQSADLHSFTHHGFQNIQSMQRKSLDYKVNGKMPQLSRQEFSFYQLVKSKEKKLVSVYSNKTHHFPKFLQNNMKNQLNFGVQSSLSQKLTSFSRSQQSYAPNLLQIPLAKDLRNLRSINTQEFVNSRLEQSQPMVTSPHFLNIESQNNSLHQKGHKGNISELSFKEGKFETIHTIAHIKAQRQGRKEQVFKKQKKKISISKQKKKVATNYKKHRKHITSNQENISFKVYLPQQANISMGGAITAQTQSKSSETFNLPTQSTYLSIKKQQYFQETKKSQGVQRTQSVQKKLSPINNYITDSFCSKIPENSMSKQNIVCSVIDKRPAHLKNLISYKRQKVNEASKNSLLSSKTQENTRSILNYGFSREFIDRNDQQQSQLIKNAYQLLKSIHVKVSIIQNKLSQRQPNQKEQTQHKTMLTASKKVYSSKHSPGLQKNLRNYAASVVSNLTSPPQQDAISHIQPLNASNSDFFILKNCQNNVKMFEDLIKIHSGKQQIAETFVCDRSYHVNPDSGIQKIQIIQEMEQNLNSTIKNSKHSSQRSVSQHQKNKQQQKLPFLTMSPLRFSQSLKQEIFVPRTSIVKTKALLTQVDQDEIFQQFKRNIFDFGQDQQWYSASGGFQNAKGNQLPAKKSKLKQGLNIFIEVTTGLSIIAKCKQLTYLLIEEDSFPFSVTKIFRGRQANFHLLNHYMLHPIKMSINSNTPNALYSVSQYYQQSLQSYLEKNQKQLFFKAIQLSIAKQMVEAIINLVPHLQKIAKNSISQQEALKFVWQKLRLKHVVILFQIVKIDLIFMLLDNQEKQVIHKTIIDEILEYQSSLVVQTAFEKKSANTLQLSIKPQQQILHTIVNLSELREFYIKQFINIKDMASNSIKSPKIL